jgi:hypothetical protein
MVYKRLMPPDDAAYDGRCRAEFYLQAFRRSESPRAEGRRVVAALPDKLLAMPHDCAGRDGHV